MRYGLIALWMLLCSVTAAVAQVSIGINLPGVSIGINVPIYPELERVPGYPVYYAPRLHSNFFFYDGMYWVYERDNWYASSWYNGPWGEVGPEMVPLYVLRIPVQYYRDPPSYFGGWRRDAPPRWGEHWGNQWEQRRSGWDKWDRRSVPAPAPVPAYQRQYSGNRYPGVEQQRDLHNKSYRYQPREEVVRQHYQEQSAQRAPAPAQKAAPQERNARPQDNQRSAAPAPAQKSTPAVPRSQPSGNAGRESNQPNREVPQERNPRPQETQRSNVPQPAQQSAPAAPRSQPPAQSAPAAPRSQPPSKSAQESVQQGKGTPQERGNEKGNDKGNDKGQDRGR